MSVDRGTKRPLPDIVDLSGDGDGGGAPAGDALCLLWQCPECTLENESYAAACEVCDTPRPDESGSGGGGSGSRASDGWTCTACTFANGDASDVSCGMCGTDKVGSLLGCSGLCPNTQPPRSTALLHERPAIRPLTMTSDSTAERRATRFRILRARVFGSVAAATCQGPRPARQLCQAPAPRPYRT
jgi:hypothetical protein